MCIWVGMNFTSLCKTFWYVLDQSVWTISGGKSDLLYKAVNMVNIPFVYKKIKDLAVMQNPKYFMFKILNICFVFNIPDFQCVLRHMGLFSLSLSDPCVVVCVFCGTTKTLPSAVGNVHYPVGFHIIAWARCFLLKTDCSMLTGVSIVIRTSTVVCRRIETLCVILCLNQHKKGALWDTSNNQVIINS